MQRLELALEAKTLLFRNFEYVKESDNVNGSTSWRIGDVVITSIFIGRVVRAVDTFGQSEILIYLRSIVHLSTVNIFSSSNFLIYFYRFLTVCDFIYFFAKKHV